jgi:hypothetical protein
VRRDLAKRLEALEAKAKPRVISTWVDFMMWLYEHENDEGELEVEFSPELQELVEEVACEPSR